MEVDLFHFGTNRIYFWPEWLWLWGGGENRVFERHPLNGMHGPVHLVGRGGIGRVVRVTRQILIGHVNHVGSGYQHRQFLFLPAIQRDFGSDLKEEDIAR